MRVRNNETTNENIVCRIAR